MPRQRNGVSPIVSGVMLMLLAMAMAAGTYTFLLEGKETVTGETQQVRLETINVSCTPGQVTWWINNTGRTPIDTPRGDLLVQDGGTINTSLSVTDVAAGGFTRAFGSGRITAAPARDMVLGREYGLEFDIGDARITAACRVGDRWWDADWQYRRALDRDIGAPTTADITMDAEQLVENGKLRADCADIRGVSHRRPVPYRVISCDPGGNVHLRVNISRAARGEAYVYYGNLQAATTEQALVNEGIVFVPLGPEEELRLP